MERCNCRLQVMCYTMCYTMCYAGPHSSVHMATQVGLLRRQLEIPEGVPEPLAQLLRECLAVKSASRPDFSKILAVLEHFLQTTRALYLEQEVFIQAPAGMPGAVSPASSRDGASTWLSSGSSSNAACYSTKLQGLLSSMQGLGASQGAKIGGESEPGRMGPDSAGLSRLALQQLAR